MARGLSTNSGASRLTDSAPTVASATVSCPLPSSCGYLIATAPRAVSTITGASDPAPPGGSHAVGAGDEPNPADREQSRQRTDEHGEHDERRGDAEPRHLVDGTVRQRHPGDEGREGARQQRRQHERQRDRPKQDLKREQRPAERNVVHRRHPCARAASDEQPPLPARHGRRVAQPARRRGSRELRRRLPAKRSTHGDDHDREHASADALHEREVGVAQPHGL